MIASPPYKSYKSACGRCNHLCYKRRACSETSENHLKLSPLKPAEANLSQLKLTEANWNRSKL